MPALVSRCLYGETQAPRQTATPSKLCATLVFEVIAHTHGKKADLFHNTTLLLTAVDYRGHYSRHQGRTHLSQSAATVIAIAKMEVGAAPTGFKFARTGQGAPSKWAVVSDSTSSEGRVIEQSSTDRTDNRFPLAIFEPFVAKNVEVSAKLQARCRSCRPGRGYCGSCFDADNYYVVRANALEDNVRFYRVVKGRREQIDGVNTKVAGKRLAQRLNSKRKMIASRSDLTAKPYSRRRTRHSPELEKLRFGKSLIA